MTQLRRTAATAEAFDLECELLTPQQAAERYPVMAVDDLVGAIWLPGDGKVNPTDLTGRPGPRRPDARAPGSSRGCGSWASASLPAG
jgi:glycine/D-amino acid oxidase-like deaminating enzyme